MNKWTKVSFGLASILSLLFLSPASVNAQLATGIWPKLGNDLKHTVYSPVSGPQADNVAWTYTTTTPSAITSSPVIAEDGTVYVGADKLYALNADGTEKWTYPLTDAKIDTTPVLGEDGTIYFAANDLYVYAINPDGTLQWRLMLPGGSLESSPTIGSDGTIYLGSYSKKLHAINPNGTIKWEFNTNEFISISSPAIADDGTIYIGTSPSFHDRNGTFWAINPDGTEKWHYNPSAAVMSSPSIAPDGTIYFGTNASNFSNSLDGRMIALNPNGTLKWQVSPGISGGDVNSAALGSDGTIYFTTNGEFGKVFALNPDSTTKWSKTIGPMYQITPLIANDETLYLGASTPSDPYNAFYALDASDGDIIWYHPNGSNQQFAPSMDDNGILYITEAGNMVVAISVNPVRQITELSPAKVWVGINSILNAGIRFDLLAEVYNGTTLISSGQINSFNPGITGVFASAKLATIPFDTFTSKPFPTGSELKLKLSVRNACSSSLRNFGAAKLWYNDSQANSRFDATIGGTNSDYFLRTASQLATSAGSGPKQTVSLESGAKCSSFKSFGTWTITP